ncbi:hypothetical protein ONZ51_g9430 [Trametes cubensis]|uniref:Uncharacterized protein n=1 Tax=Trametes cubensis TaxID=1111947 RepID=A0AAD7TLB6_9APHY|nr:hypothetical protein ONZ51_g9430 [Trametes cubensis]
MDKPTSAYLESADELLPKPRRQRSHQLLRRKVSRAFSSLTRRSTADLRAENGLSRTLTRTEPPLPSRTATTTTISSSSSSSTTAGDASVVARGNRAAGAAPYSPAYPIVRLDPVLIGCFVCL